MAAKTYSTTKTAPSDIPQEGKYIVYNRETMEHDFYYDGRYLGSRETPQEAREALNECVYDLDATG